MITRCRLRLKVAALLVTCAILQVYVVASSPATAAPNETVSKFAPGGMLFGRLSSFGSGKVMVNGNDVLSGTTILSGAQIQTTETAGATITLASAGKLDIAPKTNLTLVFDQSNVSVNVVSGDVLLTTSEGVKGTLTTADGKTNITDGKQTTSIGTSMYAGYDSNQQDKDDPNKGNNACRVAGMPCALFFVMLGGGGAVAAIFAASRGNNASPSNP